MTPASAQHPRSGGVPSKRSVTAESCTTSPSGSGTRTLPPPAPHALEAGVLERPRHTVAVEVLDPDPEVVDLARDRAACGQAAVASLVRAQADEAAVGEVERVGVADDVAAGRQPEQVAVERLRPVEIGDPDVDVMQRAGPYLARLGARARWQGHGGEGAQHLPPRQLAILVLFQ